MRPRATGKGVDGDKRWGVECVWNLTRVDKIWRLKETIENRMEGVGGGRDVEKEMISVQ